ncbi:MAG TPA: lipopolysaccharide biosynthesis protein [Candidatus Saccharimonadales bacterium]|nr:lipopolysaccharide biosynthesis protein [Candidatus Saccharimonadales bacterium]
MIILAVLEPMFVQVRGIRRNTLALNALYLMLSTFVLAGSGFVFWTVVARTYDAAAVGLATAMLSVAGLLSLLSQAGFDTTFVRFLPSAEHKGDYINSGFVLVALTATLLGVGSAVVLPRLSPSLDILTSLPVAAGFVLFSVVTALGTLVNAVFLASKRAGYILMANTALGLAKITLPLVIAHGEAVVIVLLASAAQVVGLFFGVLRLRRCYGYRFAPVLKLEVLRAVWAYSSSMYAAGILNLLPPTLLPLLVVHFLKPAAAAYYYMAFTIAGVLYAIAYGSMQSMFAEGSHNQMALRSYVIRSARMAGLLLLPSVGVLMVCGPGILSLFGSDYTQQATPVLQLFAASALPVAVYSALGAIFKVTKNLRAGITMNAVYAVCVLGISYLALPVYGLVGVGWAWFGGNVVACLTGVMFVRKSKKGAEDGTIASARRRC